MTSVSKILNVFSKHQKHRRFCQKKFGGRLKLDQINSVSLERDPTARFGAGGLKAVQAGWTLGAAPPPQSMDILWIGGVPKKMHRTTDGMQSFRAGNTPHRSQPRIHWVAPAQPPARLKTHRPTPPPGGGAMRWFSESILAIWRRLQLVILSAFLSRTRSEKQCAQS